MRSLLGGSVILVGLAFSSGSWAAEGPLPPLPSSPPEYDAPPPPPPPPPGRRSEWGAQIRLETAAMGRDAYPDAGMGGIGFSVRPRLSPHLAIDFGVDFLRGMDFYAEERRETRIFINPMFFVNPRNRAQIYLFGGLGFSGADVTHVDQTRSRYDYMGFDAGVGCGAALLASHGDRLRHAGLRPRSHRRLCCAQSRIHRPAQGAPPTFRWSAISSGNDLRF